MSVPELDPEQRRDALAKAAEARRVRAELKQMLKTGEVSLRAVLGRAEQDDDGILARTRVADVVGAMPNVGKVRARRIMEEIGIAGTRRLRGLGSKQRQRLLELFEQER